MKTLKSALQSRTVWYAIVIAILSVMQGYVFLLHITPYYQMLVGVIISIGIIFFRFITKTPL